MEIVKTKGLPDKYLWKDQKTKLIDLVPKLKRLPKSGNFKRVFYRTCPIYGRRLIPLPERITSKFYLPKVFLGDMLLNSNGIVESVLMKFFFEGERAIPIQEWVENINNIVQNLENYEYSVITFENDAQEEAWLEEINRRIQEMRIISAKSPDEE